MKFLLMVVALFLMLAAPLVKCAIECDEFCSTEDRICHGTAGNELVVPCGPPDSFSTNYTYINDSSGEVLATDSDEFLSLNLTAYDDHNTIICERGTDGPAAPFYTYELDICYSPRLLAPVLSEVGHGNLKQEFSLTCALKGNPAQTCSWRVYWCKNGTTIFDPFGVDYRDEGCTIHISELTLNYTKICFVCTAENIIGNKSLPYNPIDFNICPDEVQIFIYANNTERHPTENNSTLNVYLGDNLELLCGVHGITFNFFRSYWQPNISDPLSYQFSENYTYDAARCLQTGIRHFRNLSYSDSGPYRCWYNGKFATLYLSVQDRVIEETDSTISDISLYIGPATTVVVVVVILIAIIILALLVLHRQRMKSLAEVESIMQFDELLAFEKEYDVFLSFAEEDIVFVETKLKIPLAESGYKVCWHHDAFIPGYTIVENIERSVYKSRFMIAVLSNAFMMSDFCQRELSVASNRIKNTSEDSFLIPLILEKECELPSELHKITYIQSDDCKFMGRIKSTLGDPISCKSECSWNEETKV